MKNQEYPSNEVLDYRMITLSNEKSVLLYHYLKKLNKPAYISYLNGICIKIPDNENIIHFINQNKSSKITIHMYNNPPLKIDHNKYFIIVFNIDEKTIVHSLINDLTPLSHKEYFIGLYMDHPLCLPIEFFHRTCLQLDCALQSHCMLAVKNKDIQ